MVKEELQKRLADFAVAAIVFTKEIRKTYAGVHLSKQLIRSSTSPALNYAESRSAESISDFIHKLQICLKELRETSVCLLILHSAGLCKEKQDIESLRTECDELISIFVKSIQTTHSRYKK